jgi:hypothetical protein
MLHLAPREAHQATGQRADKALAAGNLNDPVKEVLFDHAADAGPRELLPGQDARRRQRRWVQAHDGVSDDLSHGNQ